MFDPVMSLFLHRLPAMPAGQRVCGGLPNSRIEADGRIGRARWNGVCQRSLSGRALGVNDYGHFSLRPAGCLPTFGASQA
jgi:hypothetical protein